MAVSASTTVMAVAAATATAVMAVSVQRYAELQRLLAHADRAIVAVDSASKRFGIKDTEQYDKLIDSIEGQLEWVGDPVERFADVLPFRRTVGITGAVSGLNGWDPREAAKYVVGGPGTIQDADPDSRRQVSDCVAKIPLSAEGATGKIICSIHTEQRYAVLEQYAFHRPSSARVVDIDVTFDRAPNTVQLRHNAPRDTHVFSPRVMALLSPASSASLRVSCPAHDCEGSMTFTILPFPRLDPFRAARHNAPWRIAVNESPRIRYSQDNAVLLFTVEMSSIDQSFSFAFPAASIPEIYGAITSECGSVATSHVASLALQLGADDSCSVARDGKCDSRLVCAAGTDSSDCLSAACAAF